MKKIVILGLVVVVAAFALRLGAQDAPPPAREEIDNLIQKLGASDVRVRDAATEQLKKLGEAAVPALREAAGSEDAEVATRAQQLLREIEKPKTDAAEQAEKKQTRPPNGAGRSGTGFSITFGMPGSVSIQQDSNGHIRVSVSEQRNGQSVTETYEANSPEEFKDRYPEVAKKYGIGKPGPFRFPGFDFKGFDPFEGQNEAWKQFDEQFRRRLQVPMKDLRDLQRQLEQMLRQFGRDFRTPPPQGPRPPDQGESLVPGPDDDEEDAEAAPPQPQPQPQPRRPAVQRAPAAKAELGVVPEYIEPALRAHLGLQGEEGILIAEVKEGSLAQQSGLAQYDVILRVGGQPVKTQWEFRRLVKESLATGSDFTLDAIRAGKPLTVTVKGTAPAAPPAEPEKK